MSTSRRIAKNSFLVLFSRAIEIMAGIGVVAVAARYLGVEGFGKFAFVRALIWVLSPIVCLGITQILVREISQQREVAAQQLGGGLILNLLLSGVMLAVLVLIISILGLEADIVPAIYIAGFGGIARAFTSTFLSVFIAFERMHYDTVIMFVARILAFISTVAVSCWDLGFTSLFAGLVATDIIGMLLGCIICCKKFVVPRLQVEWGRVRYLFKEAFFLGISTGLELSYSYASVFVLKILAGNVAVALFQGPNRIVSLLHISSKAVMTGFVPLLSRLAVLEETRSEFKSLYEKILKFFLVISLPMCMIGMLLSSKIILCIFGTEFTDGVLVFQILVWSVLFLFLDTLMNFTLTTIKRQKFLVISNGLCLFFNLGLSLFLVPRYGHIGACWASVAAHMVLFGVNFYFTSKCIGGVSAKDTVVRPLFAAAAVSLLLFKLNGLNVFVLALGVVILYFGLLVMLNTFSRKEIQFIKDILRQRTSKERMII